LEEVLAAMHVPFPELTDLQLLSFDYFDEKPVPVIRDSFLGGSAPRLRIFSLDNISFPGLPKLLLSATHLIDLYLHRIPHSGYISPEVMVALLSVLSSLELFSLDFQSPQSHPGRESQSLPPPKRTILPALFKFRFRGVAEYLEELVTLIDAPQLKEMRMTFFEIDFGCPRLTQFINRTPTLGERDKARVQFGDSSTSVALRSQFTTLEIVAESWIESYQRLSSYSVAQVCNSPFLFLLSMVDHLYIEDQYSELARKDYANENTRWLRLLLPFTSVKNLYLSEEFAPDIAAALQELVGGRITEVLPSLQNIFVEGLEPLGPFQENIGQFVTARQLSNHPIAISGWDKLEEPDFETWPW
jgi:hypothetical protein